MGKFDLRDDERAAANLAAQSDAGLMCAFPTVGKTQAHAEAVLHLACEGDRLEQHDLEIAADTLPLFDTHGSRHLG
jgi:hypothetical protein